MPREATSGDEGQQGQGILERRKHPRVAYPPDQRPLVIVREKACQVMDISVQAIKFLLPEGESPPRPGAVLAAEIIFHDGETLSVEGRILRVWKSEAVLQLKDGLHSARIFKERKYLMERRR
jgi:hypothetical protein